MELYSLNANTLYEGDGGNSIKSYVISHEPPLVILQYRFRRGGAIFRGIYKMFTPRPTRNILIYKFGKFWEGGGNFPPAPPRRLRPCTSISCHPIISSFFY